MQTLKLRALQQTAAAAADGVVRVRGEAAASGCKRRALTPSRAVTRWRPGSIEAAEEELERQLEAEDGKDDAGCDSQHARS